MPATTKRHYRTIARSVSHLPIIACVVAGLFLGSLAAAEQYDRKDALAFSQGAIGKPVFDFTLRDTDGQPFELSQLQGKPLVISMIYTSCHHICPMITKNLADAVSIAQDALGSDAFAVATIGFDWRVDTPERMRQFATEQGVRGTPGWYFLSIDAQTVDGLSDNLGFLYYPSAKGFDHLAQATIVGTPAHDYGCAAADGLAAGVMEVSNNAVHPRSDAVVLDKGAD